MAAKTNASASEIDKTSFWWSGMCAVCHPGGGPTEFDRDGKKYFDVATGRFGYEDLGKTAGDVTLDGDYCEVNPSNGSLRAAPWNVTGVGEPDCLYCHRADRTITTGQNMNWIWRAATLRAKDALVDGNAASVPAYAAAATAAQGWFSNITLGSVPAGNPPLATRLDVDYAPGVANGSLVETTEGHLRVSESAVAKGPVDYACWGCHSTPEVRKRGRVWFDPAKDVHYAGFNRLRDTDTGNDVPAEQSVACARCHPTGGEHNVAKGATTLGTVRDDTDFAAFRSCKDCHDAGSAARDPEAPAPANTIHSIVKHRDLLSCEMCHIPYKSDPADLVIDIATSGQTVLYNTQTLLSADPLDPTAADKSRWWPGFTWKRDHDGVSRLSPMKVLVTAWWGDWDQGATPGTSGPALADDHIAPIPLWRIRGVTAGAPLPAVADDNGDGKKEVNTTAEIRAYLDALKANDVHGNPVATRPVLVKGGKVWYDDGAGGVASFEYEGTGIKTESSHPFAADHNVLPASEALGHGGSVGCGDCHRSMNGGLPTRVFDRLILVDPWGPDGLPVYKTVRELTGSNPW